jgi:co-chaperonin GroES (HSP10)
MTAPTTQQTKATAVVDRLADENPFSQRAEALKKAQSEPLHRRIRTLFGQRILATHPYRKLCMGSTTRSGIIRPASISDRISEAGEHFYVVTVLKVGTVVERDDEIRVGDEVLVAQFSGGTIFDYEEGRETHLWVFGATDVMAVIDPVRQPKEEDTNGHRQ